MDDTGSRIKWICLLIFSFVVFRKTTFIFYLTLLEWAKIQQIMIYLYFGNANKDKTFVLNLKRNIT